MEIHGVRSVLGPLSLSGVPLDGNSLVQRIYCDESGTSAEKFLVVAAVVIDGDRQWEPLERYSSSFQSFGAIMVAVESPSPKLK